METSNSPVFCVFRVMGYNYQKKRARRKEKVKIKNRILLCEDRKEIEPVIHPILAEFNARLLTCSSVEAAFELAKKQGRKSVTVVEKPNVLRETSGLMVRTARAVAKDYPGIELWETNIDAMVMWLVKNPLDYGVLVTTNMFGDIVSDLCAQLVGGLGFASSGNIGDKLAVFEPTHGSAPKYAGQYKVNPMAMFLSTKMMFDYLGEKDKAEALEAAIAGVIKDGKCRTYDMGGSNTTLEMGEAVAERL